MKWFVFLGFALLVCFPVAAPPMAWGASAWALAPRSSFAPEQTERERHRKTAVEQFGNYLFREWIVHQHGHKALVGIGYAWVPDPNLDTASLGELRQELVRFLSVDQYRLAQDSEMALLDSYSIVVGWEKKRLLVYVGFKEGSADLSRYEIDVMGYGMHTEKANPEEYAFKALTLWADTAERGQAIEEDYQFLYARIAKDSHLAYLMRGTAIKRIAQWMEEGRVRLDALRQIALMDHDTEVQTEAVRAWMTMAGAFADFRKYEELSKEFKTAKEKQSFQETRNRVMRGWGALIRLRIESQPKSGRTDDVVEEMIGLLPWPSMGGEEAEKAIANVLDATMVPSLIRLYWWGRKEEIKNAKSAALRLIAKAWYEPRAIKHLISTACDTHEETDIRVASKKALEAIPYNYLSDPRKTEDPEKTIGLIASSDEVSMQTRRIAIHCLGLSGEYQAALVLRTFLANPVLQRDAKDAIELWHEATDAARARSRNQRQSFAFRSGVLVEISL